MWSMAKHHEDVRRMQREINEDTQQGIEDTVRMSEGSGEKYEEYNEGAERTQGVHGGMQEDNLLLFHDIGCLAKLLTAKFSKLSGHMMQLSTYMDQEATCFMDTYGDSEPDALSYELAPKPNFPSDHHHLSNSVDISNLVRATSTPTFTAKYNNLPTTGSFSYKVKLANIESSYYVEGQYVPSKGIHAINMKCKQAKENKAIKLAKFKCMNEMTGMQFWKAFRVKAIERGH
ncbi:hypothetical protein BDQ17DRAFT_1324383 [Cyathus striatus]|nr:hypothetical protein BDQ17DRAFT_1324383 [Cyathus striatus]